MWLRSSLRHIHESLDNSRGDGEGQLVSEIADSREGPFEALERKQVRLAILRALRRLSAVIAKLSFSSICVFAASRRRQEFLPSQKLTCDLVYGGFVYSLHGYLRKSDPAK